MHFQRATVCKTWLPSLVMCDKKNNIPGTVIGVPWQIQHATLFCLIVAALVCLSLWHDPWRRFFSVRPWTPIPLCSQRKPPKKPHKAMKLFHLYHTIWLRIDGSSRKYPTNKARTTDKKMATETCAAFFAPLVRCSLTICCILFQPLSQQFPKKHAVRTHTNTRHPYDRKP